MSETLNLDSASRTKPTKLTATLFYNLKLSKGNNLTSNIGGRRIPYPTKKMCHHKPSTTTT